MGRFLFLVLFLGALVLIPFALWGEGMEAMWTVARLESFGRWAWLMGVGLLLSDLLIPLPSTVVMSALGYVYGIFLGGALSALGAFGSASMGYGLCRWMGRPMAERLAGKRGLRDGESLFFRSGPWLVVLSRWIPVLAEVVACLAGLTRMAPRRFFLSAWCGCLPLGYAFAAVGALGEETPGLALAVSALGPPLLWLVAGRRLMRRQRAVPGEGDTQGEAS